MGHSRRWWIGRGKADAQGQALGSNIPEIVDLVEVVVVDSNLGWSAQTRGRERLPLPVLGLLDVEVDDHDHCADHNDSDKGGQKNERSGEGVEDLDEGKREEGRLAWLNRLCKVSH